MSLNRCTVCVIEYFVLQFEPGIRPEDLQSSTRNRKEAFLAFSVGHSLLLNLFALFGCYAT